MNGQASGKDANDLLAALRQKITETEAEMEQLRAKLADIRTAAGAPKAPADGTPVLGGEQNVFSNFTSIESPFDFTLEIENTSPNTGGFALTAISSNAGGGILGSGSNNGTGVYAFSRTGTGLFAQSIQGPGAAVQTEQAQIAMTCGNLSSGGGATPYGLVAYAENGIGINAVGGTAPIQLSIANTAGAPTSGYHQAGQLYLDSNVTLFLCKQSGTPGIWKELG